MILADRILRTPRVQRQPKIGGGAAAATQLETFLASDDVAGYYDNTASTMDTNVVAKFTAASTEYLSITDASQTGLNPAGVFSISAWVKFEADGVSRAVAAKWGSVGQRSYFIEKVTSDEFKIWISNDGTTVAVATTIGFKADGSWKLVSVVYDGTNIKISVNGGAFVSTAHTTHAFDNTAIFQIGAYATTFSPANGAIGITSFYSKALSLAQVTALYNLGTPVPYDDYSTDQLASLVSCWELNEPSGTRADRVGTNALTDTNTVTSEQFKLPFAKFVAASSRDYTITDASQTGLTPTGNFSMTCWMRTTKSGVAQGIIGKWGGTDREYVLTMEADNVLYFFVSSTGSGGSSVSAAFTSNAWTFVACVYDGTNIKISLNGGAFANTAFTANAYQSGTHEFAIGSYAGTTFHNNQIGTVGFFEAALTLGEVGSLYRSGFAVSYAELTAALKTNLVSWWDLTHRSGNAEDLHGSNDLTNNASVGIGGGLLAGGFYAAPTGAGVTRIATRHTGAHADPNGSAIAVSDGAAPIRNANGFMDFADAAIGLHSPIGAMTQSFTIIIVANIDAAVANFLCDGYAYGMVSGDDRGIIYGNAGPVWRMYAGTDADVGASSTGRHLLIGHFNGASSEFWDNDVKHVGSPNPGADGQTGLTIGARFNDATPLEGDIELIIQLDREITDAEVAALATELGI